MTKLLRRFLNDRRATSAIEFSFVLPVMLTLIAGSVEFGRWFQAYNDVNRLATRYAAVYSDCNDNPSNVSPSPQNCNVELAQYWPPAAIANIAPQLASANVSLRMFQLTYNNATATVDYSYPANATMTAAESATASATIYASGAASPSKGVLVTVQYPYVALFFPQLFQQMTAGANLNLSYTVAQKKN